MIRASGRVVAVSVDSLWVETSRSSACGNCSARVGCGQALLGSIAVAGRHRVEVALGPWAADEFKVGQLVELGLPGSALLVAAGRAWLVPLLLLVAGLLVGSRVSDLWAVIGALSGLGAGWITLRHHHFSSLGSRSPVLLAGFAATPPTCPPAPPR